MNEEEKIKNILISLSKSKFRSSFHLKEKDKEYIRKNGLEKIENHAYDFITQRLGSENIPNDGHQTPYKGHPVFISQHATATCCRSCLEKWHKINKDHNLTKKEKDYIVKLIMTFIKNETRL